MGLANCNECGKLFIQTSEAFCPECVKQRDYELNQIRDWIFKQAHPKLSRFEKETSLSEKVFMKHLLEGRIIDFTKVIVNCELCRKEIRLHTKKIICTKCHNSLKKAQTPKKRGELENSELYSKKTFPKFKKDD